MRIFLIGFMASGKTKWGKNLAQHLSIPFLDLDHLIQDKVGMSIADYFTQYGEEQFRILERDTLQSYPFPQNAIISCGGGTPCFFDNMKWLNNNGKTLYLKVAPAILCHRILNGKSARPLAKGKTPEELLSFIEITLTHRETFYQQAQLIFNQDPSVEALSTVLGIQK